MQRAAFSLHIFNYTREDGSNKKVSAEGKRVSFRLFTRSVIIRKIRQALAEKTQKGLATEANLQETMYAAGLDKKFGKICYSACAKTEDGRVKAETVLSYLQKCKAITFVVRRLFFDIDVNKDSFIDLEELRDYLRSKHVDGYDYRLEEYVKKFDADEDGRLSIIEFANLVNSLRIVEI
ncbi:hypothetical protein Ciccas_008298 [Cichlidogyrus casuarinus]|uniref:EF-hand domain-containing protein n=1 Tax=Cichlidogyrus casuarinus TaxID=1844966 RepID=A0ABD2Q0C7_9PLAT